MLRIAQTQHWLVLFCFLRFKICPESAVKTSLVWKSKSSESDKIFVELLSQKTKLSSDTWILESQKTNGTKWSLKSKLGSFSKISLRKNRFGGFIVGFSLSCQTKLSGFFAPRICFVWIIVGIMYFWTRDLIALKVSLELGYSFFNWHILSFWSFAICPDYFLSFEFTLIIRQKSLNVKFFSVCQVSVFKVWQ